MMVIERNGTEGVPDEFLDLPAIVYRNDPMWIPEEPEVVERAFSSANPWFASAAACTVCIPGAVRAAVFRDPRLTIDGRPAAFFGYFESTGTVSDDLRVMRQVEAWARDRGAEVLLGPVDFTTLGRYRIRLGAEPGAVTFPGEPYNPPDYPTRLQALGFRLYQRYLTQVAPAPLSRVAAVSGALNALCAEGFRFERATSSLWLSRLEELHPLVDAIFATSFGYTPVSRAMFNAACGESLARRICPHASTIAFAPSGDVAGFFLVYPNYGPLVMQRAGAARVPVSALQYDRHCAALASSGSAVTAVAKTTGVSPAFRQRGLMNAMAAESVRRGNGRYDGWFGAMIRADSHSRNFAHGRTRNERWYGLYGKLLA